MVHANSRRSLVLALVLALTACGAPSSTHEAAEGGAAAPPASELTAPVAAPAPTRARAPSTSPANTPAVVPTITEVKLTIRDDQVAQARAQFNLVEARAERGNVFFYDTSALDLYTAGLILRARTVKGSADDVTVKLRPLACSAVATTWFRQDGFKCEADRVGDNTVESCSFTVDQKARVIDEVTLGARGVESLFSKNQLEFVRAYAPIAPDWGRLRVLGPVPERSWAFRLPDLDKVSAELWTLPDGRELLELSTRAPRDQADRAAKALDAAVRKRGLAVAVAAESKTRAALRAFVER